VHIAPWVLEELRHDKRRPVFVHFGVWRRLNPTGRRIYAYVQGLSADGQGHRRFFLGAPLRYTLGLRSKRRDKAYAAVSDALTQLYHFDARYHCRAADGGPSGSFRPYKQPNTNGRIDAFLIFTNKGAASKPRDAAELGRPHARRPRSRRGAHALRAELARANADLLGAAEDHAAVRAAVEASLADAFDPARIDPGALRRHVARRTRQSRDGGDGEHAGQ
jgi:hypothetical protein